jgi:DNA-binding phage protein
MDIIAHIKAKGMTVRSVCRVAGISRQGFYSAIAPDGNPSTKTVAAIARALDLSPSDIRPELKE